MSLWPAAGVSVEPEELEFEFEELELEFEELELEELELELELEEGVLDELELEEGVLDELDELELEEGVLDVAPPSLAVSSPSADCVKPAPPFASKITDAIETALLVMIVKRSAMLRMIAITFISEFFIGIIPLSPYCHIRTV